MLRMHECVSEAVWLYFHEFRLFKLLCVCECFGKVGDRGWWWRGARGGSAYVREGAYGIRVLGALEREAWGLSAGDLSPLGAQARVTPLQSTTHSFFDCPPSLEATPRPSASLPQSLSASHCSTSDSVSALSNSKRK